MVTVVWIARVEETMAQVRVETRAEMRVEARTELRTAAQAAHHRLPRCTGTPNRLTALRKPMPFGMRENAT